MALFGYSIQHNQRTISAGQVEACTAMDALKKAHVKYKLKHSADYIAAMVEAGAWDQAQADIALRAPVFEACIVKVWPGTANPVE